MNLKYNFISKFYSLLDIFYFNNINTSPRLGILDFISNDKLKILEVCIGTGVNTITISENRPNSKIIGIDLSKEMLEIAEEKILKQNIKNVNTLIMDATNMDFNNNYFDVILISLVLHEVSDTIQHKIIEESKRVLKDNGKILILEWDEPKKLTQKLLFLIIKLLEPKGFKEFLKLSMSNYEAKFSLKALIIKKYSYSKILEFIKEL